MNYCDIIPAQVVFDLFCLTEGGMSREASVQCFRASLVPPGYTAHTFRKNCPETYLDQLRTIYATYKYRHMIETLKKTGVDFSMYMYIPEIDPVTGVEHHNRADHGHLLKRIAGKVPNAHNIKHYDHYFIQ